MPTVVNQENRNKQQKVPKRILSSLLSSVCAGVVPRSGAPYIAIGREEEIAALLSDLEEINEGGGTMRFLIGRYGSGKSFLIQLVRGYALERDFVTADADLTPERRFSGSDGAGLATYRELVKNLACKSSPDGGALPVVLSRWFTVLRAECAEAGLDPASPSFAEEVKKKIYGVCRKLESNVGGFDFSRVLCEYYEADVSGDDAKKSACLRWLRGEYKTRTEAKAALQVAVGSIVDDDNWYDYIKLIAQFVRFAGYRGLVLFVDECVNLYKISNRISRENNYEKILSMFNDTLQGRAPYLMMVLGGTPQFLEDTRRGLFSYDALRSRLSDSRYARSEYRDMLSPLIRLKRLTDDELLALIIRLTALHAQYYDWIPRVTDEQMVQFLQVSTARAGADTMITPREMIRDYMSLLNILYQNPTAEFSALVGTVTAQKEEPAEAAKAPEQTANRAYTLDDIEL